jgi:hypothetical protein
MIVRSECADYPYRCHVNTSKPMMNSTARGMTATSEALAMARSRIKRYITVLTIFSDASDRDIRESSIDWESFPFKAEYAELADAGFIKGEIGVPVKAGGSERGPAEVFMPRITVSGVMKLAELSDYLWKTSSVGRLVLSLIQMGWLVVGVLIGLYGNFLFSIPKPQ